MTKLRVLQKVFVFVLVFSMVIGMIPTDSLRVSANEIDGSMPVIGQDDDNDAKDSLKVFSVEKDYVPEENELASLVHDDVSFNLPQDYTNINNHILDETPLDDKNLIVDFSVNVDQKSDETLNDDVKGSKNIGPFICDDYPVEDVRGILTSFEGNGTIDDPWLIKSEQELSDLAANVNKGNNYSGKYFKLNEDIDLSGKYGESIEDVEESFSPIGSFIGVAFDGVFDGNGRTVKGLYINTPDESYCGLFGMLTGTIKNLTVSGNVTGKDFVGGIVGYNFGTIENCSFTDNGEKASSVKGENNVGGIAGFSGPNGVIDSCKSDADIMGSASSIGGIVGWANNIIEHVKRSQAEDNKENTLGGDGVIKNCTFSGTVTDTENRVLSETDKGYEYTDGKISISLFENAYGGIAGWSNGYQIQNCQNEGTITGDDFTGGIAGDSTNGTKITDCSNLGLVTGRVVLTGGVTGRLAKSTISGCINDSTVEGKNFIGGIAGVADKFSAVYDNKNINNSKVHGEDFVGGIVGLSNCRITGSENEGVIKSAGYTGGIAGYTIENISDCKNLAGSVVESTGEEGCAGGIVGKTVSQISDCINSGSVKGGGIYTGGIAGYAKLGVKNCENKNEATVEGGLYYTAGIVGYCLAPIENCKNFGNVSGEIFVAGIAGSQEGKIENCENQGDIEGSDMCAGGIAGYLTSGNIISCKNLGTISILSGKQECIGGIAGAVSENGNIKLCDNSGKIAGVNCTGGIAGLSSGEVCDCTNSANISGTNAIGGIIGKNMGRILSCKNNAGSQIEGGVSTGGITGYSDKEGEIADSSNNGNVNIIASDGGGICGNNAGKMINCSNAGQITGVTQLGGITGYNTGNIVNCKNSGRVKCNFVAAGGIAGMNKGTITDSENIGEINAASSRAGGIVGSSEVDSIIEGCTNKGQVSSAIMTGGIVGLLVGDDGHLGKIRECDNYGNILGSDKAAGGIAGYCNGLIFKCSNHVDITGYKDCLGGIAGQCDKNGSITNCSNVGTITAGGDQVGGIIGTVLGEVKDCLNKGKIIGGSYSYIGGITGAVIGKVTSCVNYSNVSGQSYVGGIAGYSNAAKIENCKNVSGANVNTSGEKSGGILGGSIFASYRIENSYIKGCINEANITGTNDVGGITGAVSEVVIDNCKNSGKIVGTSGSEVGGIAGACWYEELSNCTNTGDVSSSGPEVGGIAGYKKGKVKDCVNTGGINGTKGYIAGIVGRADCEITGCVNKGPVGSDYENGNPVGGIAGVSNQPISSCWNDRKVQGKENVGGIVGQTQGGSITQCRNTANVWAGDSYAGGIVGSAPSTCHITQCSNSWMDGMIWCGSIRVGGIAGYVADNSKIVNCYSNSIVYGGEDVAGIVGYVDKDVTVENCYVKAYDDDGDNDGIDCSAKDSDNHIKKVGALVGKKNGDITLKNNYWYYDCARKAVGWKDTRFVIAESGSYEIKGQYIYYSKVSSFADQDNFSGWDFNNVWYISGGAPRLRYESKYDIESNVISGIDPTVNPITDGDGDPEKVDDSRKKIYINSVDDLKEIRDNVNNNINLYDKTDIYLNSDIDLNGEEWIPIGDYSNAFLGSFYGQGHCITGLNVNNTDVMCSGLFGAVTNSTIKDLAVYGTVTNNNISCSWVGGIVGAQKSGTIENCMFYGSTKAEVDNDNTSVGGIVGYSSNGTIENCIHAGGEITSSLYAGGISGFAYMTKIIKCYNDSTVISLREQTGSATVRYSYGVGYVSNSQFMENSYCRSNCTVKGNNEDIEVSNLKNTTSYPGLDFSKIWGMGENHPLLQILSNKIALKDNIGTDIDAMTTKTYYIPKYNAIVPYYLFSRDGYYFNGWNTAPDGRGISYADKAPVNGNITLFAQWEKGIRYDGYVGYSSLDSDFFDNKKSSIFSISTNVDVYAGRNVIFYTKDYIKPLGLMLTTGSFGNDKISFTLDGWDDKTKSWQTMIKVSDNAFPDRIGYDVLWKSDSEDKEYCKFRLRFNSYCRISEIALMLSENSDKYVRKPVIKFNANGGELKNSGLSTSFNGENLSVVNLTESPYKRDGFVFSSWNTEPLGVGGNTYNDLGSYKIEGDATLYAQWTKQQYQIKFVNEDGTELYNTTLPAGSIPVYNGTQELVKAASGETKYEFAGWDPVISIVTGNATYKATYRETEKIYTVSIAGDVHGTASVSRDSGKKGTLVRLTADPIPGYHLKTWKVLSGNVTIKNNKFNIGTANVSIQAVFEGDYSISVTNGTADKYDSASGEIITVTAADVPDGFKFDKWTSSNGDVVFNNASSIITTFKMPAQNVAVKAEYKSKKTDPVFDAPFALQELVFNGTDQTLIGSGNTVDGEMQYALLGSDGTVGTYSGSLPTGRNAGEYTVYYKVIGDENHFNTEPVSIKVTIFAKTVSNPEVTLSSDSYNYDGKEKKPSVTVKDGTTVIPSSEYTLGYSNNKNAGTAKVTITDNSNGNYIVNGSKTFVIKKSERNMPNIKSENETVFGKKDGKLLGLDATMEISATSAESGYSALTDVSGEGYAAGTYYVRYKESENYKASDAATVNILPGSKLIVSFLDGSEEYTECEVGYNEKVKKPADPKKENYKFIGWYSDEVLSKTYDFDSSITENIKIYAGWKEVTNPVFNAPIALQGLEFNGTDQTLISSGNTVDGEMQYALLGADGTVGTYSGSLPKGRNAGEYTVYYKVIGDENHFNTEPVSLKVTIFAKNVSNPEVTLSSDSYTYDGNDKKPSVTVKDGTTVIPSSEYTLVYSNNKNAGTAKVTITDNSGGNFIVNGSKTFVISKSERNVPDIKSENETVYGKKDGKLLGLDATMEISATSAESGYSALKDVSGEGYSAGTYYIRYKESENYKVSNAATVKILPGSKLKVSFHDGSAEYTVFEIGYNEKVKKPADPKKENYKFIGWYSDEILSKTFDFDTNITDNVKVYAGWNEVKSSSTSEPVTPSPTPVTPSPTPVTSSLTEISSNTRTYPYSEITKIVNKDGSVTTITITYYEDGSIRKLVVTEWPNGNKDTVETLVDANGKLLYKMTEKVRFNKKRTKTVKTSIWQLDGYSYSSIDRTYKSGKGSFSAQSVSADGSKTNIKETRKSNGNLVRKSIEKDSKGIVELTITVKDSNKYKTVAVYRVKGKGKVTLIKLKTNKREITVPNTVYYDKNEKYMVTAIAKKAFRGNKTIEVLTIGKNVINIGKNAVYGLKTVNKVIFQSDKLEKVAKNAFSDINMKAVFRIKAKGKKYSKIVNLIRKSGVSDQTIFEEIIM